MSLTSSPTYDNPATKRVALIYGCNPRTQSRYSGTECAHIEVQIMRVDESGGYRWTDWSSGAKTAYFVNNLVLRCQFELKANPLEDPNYLYGFQARFMDMSYIDLDVAAHMARTLKRVGLAKYEDCTGHGVEFARYLTATLQTLGVNAWACYKDDQSRGNLAQDVIQPLNNFRELYKRIDAIAEAIRNS